MPIIENPPFAYRLPRTGLNCGIVTVIAACRWNQLDHHRGFAPQGLQLRALRAIGLLVMRLGMQNRKVKLLQDTPMRFAPARPFFIPIASFAAVILSGTCLLLMPVSRNEPVSWIDALFVATSAVSVTGLSPFDAFHVFNKTGQTVILILMQLGGLGVLTFTTLAVFLIRRRVSLSDRIAVEQSIYCDAKFNLKSLLLRVVAVVFGIECAGAIGIWVFLPDDGSVFNAIFLSISAFCNAGFAPWADSLERFRSAWGLNITLMLLIISGGLGFFVLVELAGKVASWRPLGRPVELSFYSRMVVGTTVWLILGGSTAIFLLGCINPAFDAYSLGDRLCAAFFESVTCRTAGFATVNQAHFSSASLLLAIFLMMIGGSPGSCAGGIKTTTFRVLCAFMTANFRGRSQAVALGRAFDKVVVKKALLLLAFSLHLIFAASFAILLLEQGATPHDRSAPFFDIFFEVVSAFCTVGLSINLTPELCGSSKLILCLLMFTGKVGPIWLLATVQGLQKPPAYRYPEETLPVG